MKQDNNSFTNRIIELNEDLRNAIRSLFIENDLSEIDISDAPDRIDVAWWDNHGQINEGQVLRVFYDGEELSLEIKTEDDPIRVYESDDFAFETPRWLEGIRANIFNTLNEKQEENNN